jgi:hypothetical protein
MNTDNNLEIKMIGEQVILNDLNNPINAELKEWLEKCGISSDFFIEDEAKEMVLNALQDPDFESAHIDAENGLVIEFKEQFKGKS